MHSWIDHPLSRVVNSEVITSNDAFIADQHDIKACRKMTALVNTCLFLLVIVSEFLPNNDNIAVAAEPQRSSRIKDISDDDILEALAILLSEEVEREARQNGEFEQFDDLDPEEEERASLNRQLARQDFEDVLGTCTTTGYEVNTREECEEINEIKCEPINITKFNTEIVTRCKTQVDQSCNVTYIDVPSQECQPKPRNRSQKIFHLF